MNTNYFIPTLVVDDFFEDPDYIRQFALSQEYNQISQAYPGKRTAPLYELDEDLFQSIINRFFGLFYETNSEDPYQWNATAYFQQVEDKFVDGWIHRDEDALMTGIVYLNEDYQSDAGTSIYVRKSGSEIINSDIKEKFFRGDISYEESKPAQDENNAQFEEVINLKNRYNRFVAFDSNRYHGANQFNTQSNEPRLTLIFFVYNLHVKKYPIYRMKTQ
jgi:hypothetical protein